MKSKRHNPGLALCWAQTSPRFLHLQEIVAPQVRREMRPLNKLRLSQQGRDSNSVSFRGEISSLLWMQISQGQCFMSLIFAFGKLHLVLCVA